MCAAILFMTVFYSYYQGLFAMIKRNADHFLQCETIITQQLAFCNYHSLQRTNNAVNSLGYLQMQLWPELGGKHLSDRRPNLNRK